MTTRVPPPQCSACFHLAMAPEHTCKAFPEGIPDEIWSNEVDHRKPFEGDNGVRWAPFAKSVKYPK
jgi:hypothetical protein